MFGAIGLGGGSGGITYIEVTNIVNSIGGTTNGQTASQVTNIVDQMMINSNVVISSMINNKILTSNLVNNITATNIINATAIRNLNGSGTNLTVRPANPVVSALEVQAHTNQAATIFNVLNSAGSILLYVGPTGEFVTFGNITASGSISSTAFIGNGWYLTNMNGGNILSFVTNTAAYPSLRTSGSSLSLVGGNGVGTTTNSLFVSGSVVSTNGFTGNGANVTNVNAATWQGLTTNTLATYANMIVVTNYVVNYVTNYINNYVFPATGIPVLDVVTGKTNYYQSVGGDAILYVP